MENHFSLLPNSIRRFQRRCEFRLSSSVTISGVLQRWCDIDHICCPHCPSESPRFPRSCRSLRAPRSIGVEFLQLLLRFLVRRVEFERLFVCRNGLVVKPLCFVRFAQLDLDVSLIGFQFERLPEGCDGLVIAFFVKVSQTEVEVRLRVLRIKLERLFEGVDRFVIARQRVASQPQIMIGPRARLPRGLVRGFS